jgi:methylated-DNA-[protein]-cysteine S-methyltransferase
MKLAQWVVDSKVGPLYLVASEVGLRGVFWKPQTVPILKTRLLAKAEAQLDEYFLGKRKKFDLPLDVPGTPFQKRVWRELSRIPYGKTCSYRALAMKIKKQKAYRAVGSANGKNPLCIVVPCHRVVASNGTLGGYSGGLAIKSKLLELEGS